MEPANPDSQNKSETKHNAYVREGIEAHPISVLLAALGILMDRRV